METSDLFSNLLGLSYPYQVTNVETVLDTNQNQTVVIIIEIDKTYRPQANLWIQGYYEREWRHLNLFQYPCYLHCKVPSYFDKDTQKSFTLDVPWSRQGSGFSMVFEQYVLALIKLSHQVGSVAAMLGEYPQRIWDIFNAYTKEEQPILQTPTQVGIDETSTHKGHEYITLFVDMNTSQIVDIEEGKGSDAIKQFAKKLPNSQEVKQVSIDMSPAFIKGVRDYLPNANITFDKFHIVKHLNEAIDELEAKNFDLWQWHRHLLAKLWHQTSAESAAAFLAFWADYAKENLNGEKIAKSLYAHFDGIINYFNTHLNNGLLEGINNKVQLIKRTARGYKYKKNFATMIRFCFGSLNLANFHSPRQII